MSETPLTDGLRKGIALLLANGAKPGVIRLVASRYAMLANEGTVKVDPYDECPSLDGWEIWVTPDA